MTELGDLLAWAADEASQFRASLDERPVHPSVDVDTVRKGLGDLVDEGATAKDVLQQLVDAVTPAITGTAGPRYFGFVVGGALDSATGAEILATGWDQPAYNALSSPAAAIVEEVVGEWLKELL